MQIKGGQYACASGSSVGCLPTERLGKGAPGWAFAFYVCMTFSTHVWGGFARTSRDAYPTSCSRPFFCFLFLRLFGMSVLRYGETEMFLTKDKAVLFCLSFLHIFLRLRVFRRNVSSLVARSRRMPAVRLRSLHFAHGHHGT